MLNTIPAFCRDGLVLLNSMYYSCRGLGYSSHNPQSGSQPTITPVPEDLKSFSDIFGKNCTHAVQKNTYRQDKNKIK